MFTDESSFTKCFYYICIVNDLLYEKRKIKEMKVKKKKKKMRKGSVHFFKLQACK